MAEIVEKNLDTLIRNMSPALQEETYVFVSSNMSFADAAKLDPVMIFQENEGTTLILKESVAIQKSLYYIYESRMITLNINSSLDAVGFLAKITNALADNNISVNPVSAHFHDHLFVPKDKSDLAMNILKSLMDT